MELNADVGEGGPDAEIMPHVQRVSVACGGHAGDAGSMRAALQLAKEYGVMAGAHPGYPDPANFGRRPMPASPAEIRRWVVGQTQALLAAADELGMKLFHVKPHGALYNRAAADRETAGALIAAMRELQGLSLVALAGSPLAAWAREAGVVVLEEAFADRRYLMSGTLAPRSEAGAVIENPHEVCAQAKKIAAGLTLPTLDGGFLQVRADTLCLHGEGPRAAELARLLGEVLRLG
ncbi:MAG: 5-oxoprolinase subunit PxpA [Pseudomonadota bacterium]